MSTTDKLRMIAWLLIGLALYAASTLAGIDNPQLQTILHKLGHVTTLAWVGYWISRNALGRITDRSGGNERIARAIVIAGAILGGSMGL